MYRPARMGNGIEIWGIPEVQKKFEITHPEQVIDYLGMMGDAVDNIPGLPGVGDKTAKKFLAQYGSMEELLANTADLKGKLKEKIEANKALGLLSKKLARIMLDVPVQFDANDYKLSDPNIPAVSELFQELEFRRLSETFVKVFKPTEAAPEVTKTEAVAAAPVAFDLFNQPGSGQSESTSAFKSLDSVPHHYQCVNSELERKLLLQTMQRQKSVCFDTETTGLDAVSASLVGIAFSWQAHTGYYVPIPEDADARKAVLDSLMPFFENDSIEKVGQNLKYDLKVMQQHGISVKGKLFDTMLAHYIINPDMRHNMDVLAETYLGYRPKPITDLIGKKGKNQGSMRDVPLDQQTEYAAEDADITWQLKEHFEKELGKNEQRALLDKVELPLVRVLAAMELAGISIDVPYLNEMSKVLQQEATALEQRIFEQAGETFNLASPKQLGPILFDKLKLVDKPKKTKTGQYSTAEEVLSTLAKDHPIVANILEWRSVQKLNNTYVSALPEDVNATTNRIHTVYNQAVAATGRLSSNHPNLQNIPIRTPRGQQVRKAFVAKDDEHVLMAADYSQIELRIIASLSEDPSMLAAFNNNEDIHAATAAKVFGVPISEVSREQRSQAKTVNFGIIYGVSAFGLSNQTTLNRKEAKALIEAYYESYPKLKAYMSQQVDFAREHGYVATVLGRRRYLKDINSRNAIVRGAAERNAINAPIQGSAADIIKLAMLTIYDKMQHQNFKTQMLLQVHDELVFECPKSELEALKHLVKTEMEAAYSLQVPLTVDMGIGHNWLEAH
jgi:DNA polymerase-1